MLSTNLHKEAAIIGYSGHGYVAADILNFSGYTVTAYCDNIAKEQNPFNLEYLGNETDGKAIEWLKAHYYFISVGDNIIREKIFHRLSILGLSPINAIHPSSVIASSVKKMAGIMVAASVVINPLANIGNGVICNTSCTIDHECEVSDFAHIGPGAILCGNVKIGKRSFVGAGAVVRQGITIGNDVMIGAGTVVIKDVAHKSVVVGNPQRNLK